MATYDSSKPSEGAEIKLKPFFDLATGVYKSMIGLQWQTKADVARAKEIKENECLFFGKHFTGDGGPWLHPYLTKIANGERIPYRLFNLLGKATSKYADLILSNQLKITSETNQEILDKFDWNRIRQTLLRASYAGFDGLQAYKDIDDKVYFALVSAEILIPRFNADDSLRSITKNIYFTRKIVDKVKEFVYQEIHYRGSYELHLYEVEANTIVAELDIMLVAEYLEDVTLQSDKNFVETGLDDFLISIVWNDIVARTVISDYTISAKRTQKSLNDRETKITRILDQHGDPTAIVPRNAAKQDSTTGKWEYHMMGKEVLFVDKESKDLYGYLTWDGQLTEARTDRDSCIQELCTELDLAPQLLSIYNLMPNAGPAETSSKLKQMLNSTLVRAERKRDFLDKALRSLIKNLLVLSDSETPDDFAISYPDMIARLREEILTEVITRKGANLIDTTSAIMTLDGITEEEAKIKADKIMNEAVNEVKNPWQQEF